MPDLSMRLVLKFEGIQEIRRHFKVSDDLGLPRWVDVMRTPVPFVRLEIIDFVESFMR